MLTGLVVSGARYCTVSGGSGVAGRGGVGVGGGIISFVER